MKHPKEKAKELCQEMAWTGTEEKQTQNNTLEKSLAKKCALIAVDEIMKCTKYENQKFENDRFSEQYWEEVKQEIELL